MADFVSNDRYAETEMVKVASAGEFVTTRLTGGGFVVSWLKNGIALAQVYDAAGEAKGQVFQISDPSSEQSDSLVMTHDANGGFVIILIEFHSSPDGPKGETVARHFSADGVAVSEPAILDSVDGRPGAASALSGGGYVVAWTAADSDQSGVFTQRFGDDDVPAGPRIQVNQAEALGQYGPQMTALPNGGYVVTWVSDASSIFAQAFDAQGARAGSAIHMTTFGQSQFEVGALANGNFVLVWPESGDLKAQIYTPSGVAQGQKFAVHAATPDAEGSASIVATDDGGFVVAWCAPVGASPNAATGPDIVGQRFDSHGALIGENFVVSDAPNGQYTPSLTAFGSGDLAAVFVSYDEGTGAKIALRLMLSAQHGTAADDVLSSDRDALYGLAGNDTLTGAAGDDHLEGGDGNDTLVGAAGNDVLSGGAGNDRLDGGTGSDTASYLDAAAGVVLNLSITGSQDSVGAGQDTLSSIENLRGSRFNDMLTGNSSSNRIFGEAGADALSGGGGNDVLDGGTGTDTLAGGVGNDSYIVDDSADVVVEGLGEGTDTVQSTTSYTLSENVENLILLGADYIDGTGNALANDIRGNGSNNRIYGQAGADVVHGAGGDDTLLGMDGNDTLYGDAEEDYLSGGAGNDHLIGGDGFDRLSGGQGNDLFDGGSDDDTATFLTATNGVNVSLQISGAQATGEGSDTLVSIERLVGSYYDDRLTGDSGVNFIDGQDGNDVLDGKGGADTMQGQTGNDTYVVDNVGDIVSELTGEGEDTVQASISLVLSAPNYNREIENLTLTGTSSLSGTGNALANDIRGNSGSNVLNGDAGDDRLFGNDGNDTLTGGLGYDRLYGGLGNDIYVVSDTTDFAYENAEEGTDTVLASLTTTLRANIERLTLTGVAAISGTGNDLANLITGNDAANRLTGLAGDDRLTSGGGNDTLDGGAGDDRLYGGAGNDIYIVSDATDYVYELAGEGLDTVKASINLTLRAEVENLVLTGTANLTGTGNGLNNVLTGNAGANLLSGAGGSDKLYGLAGNDVLKGDDGDDQLQGGAGRDRFYGGAGKDGFVFADGDFAGLTSATCDQVHDFSQADRDLIRLSLVDANSVAAGDQAFAFIGSEAFSHVAGQLRYEQISGNTYVSGDTNGDGTADFLIRLDGLHTLTSGDFVL